MGSLAQLVLAHGKRKREREREREREKETDAATRVSSAPAPSPCCPCPANADEKENISRTQYDAPSFYGARWADKLSKKGVPSHVYAFFKSCWELHRGDGEGGRYSVYKDPFKTFFRQKQMFDWVDSLGPKSREGLRYFTFESSSPAGSGKAKPRRHFLATTLRRFWRHYSVMPCAQRHYYELIREQQPCHMYYDLEFETELNPGKASMGDALIDRVIDLTREEVRQRFGIESIDSQSIVELDSSTERKFSRHLIIRLGEAMALASNAHAGTIASSVVANLRSKIKHEEEGGEGDRDGGCTYRDLLVMTGEEAVAPGETAPTLIDLSVYSRNRTFRIWKSSKHGKTKELLPTMRFRGREFWRLSQVEEGGRREGAGGASDHEKAFFMDSLVTRMKGGETLLTCPEAPESKQARVVVHNGGSNGGGGPSKEAANGCGGGDETKFPLLFEYISAQTSPDGMPLGKIRSLVEFLDSKTIILNLAHNRYCARIKRQHKSNGVFIVVDCAMGRWWQKCYDPECRSYRGEPMILPLNVMMEVSSNFSGSGGEVEEEVEDGDFLKAIEDILEHRSV